MTWKRDLLQTKKRVDRVLDSFFQSKITEARALHPSFAEMAREIRSFTLRGKSKRLRPYLVRAGYMATGKKPTAALDRVGAALECFHNSLLIHDDIIDRDELRRGGPTIHRVYAAHHARRLQGGSGDHFGQSAAILAGNVLSLYGVELFASAAFPAGIKQRALESMATILQTTNYGEFLDVLNAVKTAVPLKDVDLVNLTKTARYSLEGPLTTGAQLAGASPKLLKTLRSIAIPLGLAFQVQDDLLGMFGDQKTTGKSVLSDLREGKKTSLIMVTLKLASKTQKVTVKRLVGKPNATMSDLRRIRSIVSKSGARERVGKLQKELIQGAVDTIDRDRLIDPKVRNVLRSFSTYMISRTR